MNKKVIPLKRLLADLYARLEKVEYPDRSKLLREEEDNMIWPRSCDWIMQRLHDTIYGKRMAVCPCSADIMNGLREATDRIRTFPLQGVDTQVIIGTGFCALNDRTTAVAPLFLRTGAYQWLFVGVLSYTLTRDVKDRNRLYPSVEERKARIVRAMENDPDTFVA